MKQLASNILRILQTPSREFRVFLAYPRNMRILILTNFIYALVLPIIEIFIAAYVMRNTQDTKLVMWNTIALFTGIPITFLLNGWLLRHISTRTLFAAGMLLSGVSMTILISLTQLNTSGVIIAGLVMGLSYGLYWSNRDYLALSSTRDDNRNYYYGVETFLGTLCGIIMPITIGWFIATSAAGHWFGENQNNAYRVLVGALFTLATLASVVIHRGDFKNPAPTPYIFWRFNRVWYWMQLMAVGKGLAQGFFATAPAMLVMTKLGDEGTLGTVQTASGIISALALYTIGRLTKPQHRLWTFFSGLFLFFLGTFFNALLFNATGVILFFCCFFPSKPLLDASYFPIQMRVIDLLSRIENRNSFAYIFNHEFGLYVGRIFGCSLFLAIAAFISQDAALRYALLFIGALQFLSIFVAKIIMKKCDTLATEHPATINNE